MHLFIVRHGQCLGQCEPPDPSADSALSALGEQQSRLTARRLADTIWATTEREAAEREQQRAAPPSTSARPPHVLSSPLIRALGTASIIADALGDLPIDVRTELRELYASMHRGLGRAALQRRFPRASLPDDLTDAGWEHGDGSLEAVLARCQRTISILEEGFAAEDRVIMVTHGGFANVLLQALLGLSPAAPSWFAMDNGAITRLRLVPGRERRGWPPLFPPVAVEVASVNDTAHLQQCPR